MNLIKLDDSGKFIIAGKEYLDYQFLEGAFDSYMSGLVVEIYYDDIFLGPTCFASWNRRFLGAVQHIGQGAYIRIGKMYTPDLVLPYLGVKTEF